MKKSTSTITRSVFWLIIILLLGCSNKILNEKKKLPSETEIKKALLQKFPDKLDGKIQPLETLDIPFANGEYPIDFVVVKNYVFVAENNRGKIYGINLENNSVKELFGESKSNIRLIYPTTIKFFKDNLLLFDNEGLKKFDREGRFLSLNKVFNSVSHFDIDSNGIIYANSLVSKSKEENPLILKINEQGEVLEGFGKRNSTKSEEEAYVSINNKFIITGKKNFQSIQVFNKNDNSLVKDFPVSHPIFAELGKSIAEFKDDFLKEGKTFLPRYVAGVKILDEKVFVLLFLPYVEIVELDLRGNEITRYQVKDKTNCFDYFGFDVRLVGEQHQFIVGAMTSPFSPTLKLLTTFKQVEK